MTPAPDCASPTVEELISQLRSSFFSHEFQHVAKTLILREQHLNDIYLKLKTKAEEEKELLISENLQLKDELKKKDNEIEAMNKVNGELERKIRVYDHNNVFNLGRMPKESARSLSINLDNKEQKESKKQSFLSEKDSKKQTEPKMHDIFLIDDDDDDDEGDTKHISTLNRKGPSNVIKREYSIEKEDSKKKTEPKLHGIIRIIDDEDDDNKCKSSLKEKQVLNEIKRERNAAAAAADDLEFISTPKRKRVSSETKREKFELDGSAFDSGSDSEKVNKSYMFSCSKMKKQGERWKLESDMVKDFEKDVDLCMNGVCALHRQNAYVHGSDITRLCELARKLIDGDSEHKLQKKASELNHVDLNLCRCLAKKYSKKLFDIYINKSDPFFPTSR